jgi:alpha-mannosidase
LVAVVDTSHPGSIAPGKAGVSCSPGNVVISAVKCAEDQPAGETVLVIRFFESHGEPTTARIEAGWTIVKAKEVNMIEEYMAPLPIDHNSVSVKLGAHEIKTIKLYVRK